MSHPVTSARARRQLASAPFAPVVYLAGALLTEAASCHETAVHLAPRVRSGERWATLLAFVATRRESALFQRYAATQPSGLVPPGQGGDTLEWRGAHEAHRRALALRRALRRMPGSIEPRRLPRLPPTWRGSSPANDGGTLPRLPALYEVTHKSTPTVRHPWPVKA